MRGWFSINWCESMYKLLTFLSWVVMVLCVLTTLMTAPALQKIWTGGASWDAYLFMGIAVLASAQVGAHILLSKDK